MSGDGAIRAGETAEQAGDLVQAAAHYQSALDQQDLAIVADGHFHLGRVAWRQGRYEASLASYEEARSIAVQIGSDEIRARAENGIGAVHYARGAYAQARASYGVALEYTKVPSLRAKIILNLGVIANIEGDLETARQHYQRSRAIFEEFRDAGGEALALHNIGMLHADRGEWEEADEAYARCLRLSEEQGNRQMVANVLLNRSELSIERESFEEAIGSCELALSIYSAIGDEVGRGEAMRWRGHAQRRMGQLEAAERTLTEAGRIAHRTQVKLLEAEAMRDLGLTHLALGDRPSALKSLQRSLLLFQQLGAMRDVDDVQAHIDQMEEGEETDDGEGALEIEE